MDIYFINIEKFKKNHNEQFLDSFSDKTFINPKRMWEYAIGRYLIKSIAKKIYKLSSVEIMTKNNGKPVFKNSNLNFSLSHSNEYVVAVFDTQPCAVDIELVKNRDLTQLSNRYKQNFNSLVDFYKFWTCKEALYKLGTDAKEIYTTTFEQKYILTAASVNEFQKPIKIIDYSIDFI